jgi:hypothetical protein
MLIYVIRRTRGPITFSHWEKVPDRADEGIARGDWRTGAA